MTKTSDGSFLGVECGATRSVALLAPGDGAQILRAEFGPANLRLLNDAEVIEHFTAIRGFVGRQSSALTGIAIGMAGTRTQTDRQRLLNAAASVWPDIPCYATNDLETALVAGESGKGKLTRVLILSGTGSCCFGRKVDGSTLRYGGWGHIIGDKGSGYDIGLQALKAAIHSLDRDGKWSLLGQKILQSLLLNEPEDLIDWARTAGKSEVAALTVQVFEAAAEGDKLAKEILTTVAETLASEGVSCARRMVKAGTPVEFIFSGSVLMKQPAFAKKVKSLLVKMWPKASVTALNRESAFGALMLAQQHFGADAISPDSRNVQTVAAQEAPKSNILPILNKLSPTEQRNPRSIKLDQMSLVKAAALMIEEEGKVTKQLLKQTGNIAKAVEMIVASFQRGGRLFYVGAGTSGRLGVLDAVECPPTFRISPERVQGILAGGPGAVFRSVEGAEDNAVAGASAIDYRGINQRDVVVGIAASGRTPFVWGALAEAKKKGAKTMFICFNPYITVPAANKPDILIAVDAGPEVLTGSTRLKAGTATKVILNTLTTLSMVRMGKVLSNLMVDLNASNKKLRERAVRIVQAVTGADAGAAQVALEKSKWIVKDACQRLR